VLALIEMMKATIAIPQQVIIQQGEPASCMFFLTRGVVVVNYYDLASERTHELSKLKNGSYFGEMALLQTKNGGGGQAKKDGGERQTTKRNSLSQSISREAAARRESVGNGMREGYRPRQRLNSVSRATHAVPDEFKSSILDSMAGSGNKMPLSSRSKREGVPAKRVGIRRASVVAEVYSELEELPFSQIMQLLATHPGLRQELELRASKRQKRNQLKVECATWFTSDLTSKVVKHIDEAIGHTSSGLNQRTAKGVGEMKRRSARGGPNSKDASAKVRVRDKLRREDSFKHMQTSTQQNSMAALTTIKSTQNLSDLA
jgi:CRP-like cAMP-binding protein